MVASTSVQMHGACAQGRYSSRSGEWKRGDVGAAPRWTPRPIQLLIFQHPPPHSHLERAVLAAADEHPAVRRPCHLERVQTGRGMSFSSTSDDGSSTANQANKWVAPLPYLVTACTVQEPPSSVAHSGPRLASQFTTSSVPWRYRAPGPRTVTLVIPRFPPMSHVSTHLVHRPHVPPQCG